MVLAQITLVAGAVLLANNKSSMTNLQFLERITQIEKFCKENSMALFYGHTLDEWSTTIEWDEKHAEDGTGQLLKIAKIAGTTVLHLQRVYNDIEINEETLEEILSYLDEDEEEERTEILQQVALVRQTKGHLISYTLSFFYQGGCYSCTEKAELEPAYSAVEELVYGIADEDDEVYNDDVDEQSDEMGIPPVEGLRSADDSEGRTAALQLFWKQGELNKDEVEQQARKLIQNEKYLRGKNKAERRTAAKQIFDDEGYKYLRDHWLITEKAEELYQEVIVPKLEQEYVEKIKTYIASTKKPTMTQAARLLKMDVRRVGPYWEQAQC